VQLTPLEIEGSWLAESPIWNDQRGFFREWFKSNDIKNKVGREFCVEQANISSSIKGSLRGIHYSLAPRGQAKWITCISGSIKDVIVDIRPKSKTYGKWIEVELSGTSGNAVLIGKGLGHGFIALADASAVAYILSSPFSPTEEFEINPLDPSISINWGLPNSKLIVSDKDKNAPGIKLRFEEGKLPK
jgi:dTDP-4-dehydrorhamnose 3,5-epimerase